MDIRHYPPKQFHEHHKTISAKALQGLYKTELLSSGYPFKSIKHRTIGK